MTQREDAPSPAWRASVPLVVGLLGAGLLAFSFMLPAGAAAPAPPAPIVTETAQPKIEVAKGAPPSALPDPPPKTPVSVDCAQVPCVALTFDDGPSAHTGALLDKLAELGVKATFFDTGSNAAGKPDLVKRQVAEGHAVGGHSWRHQDMKKRPADEACEDASRTARAIRDASGLETTLVRPPYGSWNDGILAVCAGMSFILWDVDTQDWDSHNVAKIAAHAIDDPKPGSIILMHDTIPETIEALPAIVAGLRDRGFALVTVPELLGGAVEPGQAFYSGPRAGV
jgi:peptidoglycan/xylan/chitin deacetylase (PgdA/CDA1 family)